MPQIYSYKRISTSKQQKGSGLRQQDDTVLLEELSLKYNIPISNEKFKDIAKSAFHGQHLNADLGRFISLIDTGYIKKGSILVISSLDRLSRQSVNLAQETLLSIVNRGVGIYTMIDDKLYTDDDDNLAASLIISIIYLARANDESVNKSKRSKEATIEVIKGILSKDPKFFKDGYAKSVKVGRTNWWLDDKNGFIRPHKTLFALARRIVDLTLERHSIQQIQALLANEEGFKSEHVRKFHNYEILTGVRTIDIDSRSFVIPDYAPAVCTETELLQMQQIRKGKQHTGSGTPKSGTGLLNGIGVLKCGYCGGSMSIARQGKKFRYRCSTAQQHFGKCKPWGFYINELDKYIVNVVRTRTWQPEQDSGLPQLMHDRALVENKLNGLSKMLDDNVDSLPRIFMAKLSQAESELDEINDKIKSLKISASVSVNKIMRQFFAVPESVILDISEHDLRLKFREVLKDLIDEVICKKEEEKRFSRKSFVIGFTDGSIIETTLD